MDLVLDTAGLTVDTPTTTALAAAGGRDVALALGQNVAAPGAAHVGTAAVQNAAQAGIERAILIKSCLQQQQQQQ